jgi:hypothetical protein
MTAKRLFVVSLVLLMTACAGLFGSSKREGVSSSLVDYLYPDGEKPPEQAVNIRGFSALEQTAHLYDLEVTALVSVARKRRGA